jgi:nucleoside-diphosphate-sugar epimerase
MNSKKVFITGIFGYLGSALAKNLLGNGYQVSGIDNLCYEQNFQNIVDDITSNNKDVFNYNITDTRDFILLKKLVDDYRPDYLVHFGDLSSVYSCNHNPLYTESVNIGGAKNIISIASEMNIPLLINSTSSLYGVQKNRTLCVESDELQISTDLYCSSKIQIEHLLNKKAIENQDFKYISFRPATVFGQGSRFRIELLPNHFCFSAIKNGEIRVADLNAYRAFIHIDKLISAYSHIIKNNFFNNKIYNIGSFNLTKLEVALSIQRTVNSKIVTIPDIGDIRNLQISSNLFSNEAKFNLEDNFDSRIKDLVEWMTPKINYYCESNFNGLLNMPLTNWKNII